MLLFTANIELPGTSTPSQGENSPQGTSGRQTGVTAVAKHTKIDGVPRTHRPKGSGRNSSKRSHRRIGCMPKGD